MSADAVAADAFASAASVRAGKVSAAELVEASLDAIARGNPAINAFTVVLADEARAQTRDATPQSHEAFRRRCWACP